MSDDLDDLERRVREKWAAAATRRIDVYSAGFTFDVAEWFGSLADSGEIAMPDDWPQFPREQWISYPNKRTAALIYADHLLDHADDLTDEQWSTLCLVMHYGGKTRVA